MEKVDGGPRITISKLKDELNVSDHEIGTVFLLPFKVSTDVKFETSKTDLLIDVFIATLIVTDFLLSLSRPGHD